MTHATMNKGMTFFRHVGRQCEVICTDTIEQAGRVMRSVFDGPVYEVTYTLTRSESVPPVATQIDSRLRKLRKIAAIAGRVVTRYDVCGNVVTFKVAL